MKQLISHHARYQEGLRGTHLDEQIYFPPFQVVKTLYLLIMKHQGRKKKRKENQNQSRFDVAFPLSQALEGIVIN